MEDQEARRRHPGGQGWPGVVRREKSIAVVGNESELGAAGLAAETIRDVRVLASSESVRRPSELREAVIAVLAAAILRHRTDLRCRTARWRG